MFSECGCCDELTILHSCNGTVLAKRIMGDVPLEAFFFFTFFCLVLMGRGQELEGPMHGCQANHSPKLEDNCQLCSPA